MKDMDSEEVSQALSTHEREHFVEHKKKKEARNAVAAAKINLTRDQVGRPSSCTVQRAAVMWHARTDREVHEEVPPQEGPRTRHASRGALWAFLVSGADPVQNSPRAGSQTRLSPSNFHFPLDVQNGVCR